MDFKNFAEKMSAHFDEMQANNESLFIVDADPDDVWNKYLDSFPQEKNLVFRKRRKFDCSCCRRVVKNIGNVVAIKNGKLISVWDFQTNRPDTYQPVVDALSDFIKTKPIVNPFYINKNKIESNDKFGVFFNYERADNGEVLTWHHFSVNIQLRFICSDDIPARMAQYRDSVNVFKRALNEFTMDAIDTVLELIAQNSLYRGKEFEPMVLEFKNRKVQYDNLDKAAKELYVWDMEHRITQSTMRFRNTAIGTLVEALSKGEEIDAAVAAFEKIVAPQNYKRPKAVFTKKMIEDAQRTVTDLGYMNSLGRRFANLDDITVNNILFCNRDAAARVSGAENPFEVMSRKVSANTKEFGRAEEITVDKFIKNVLPTATNVELFMENRFEKNMVSLIAPQDKDASSMFKWPNGFSWAYAGNLTDSQIKDNVKIAGGKVDGVLRFSIQWNDIPGKQDNNDLDAHCRVPNGSHIYYANRSNSTGGVLDVDIRFPTYGKAAVENITWPSLENMAEGEYLFSVNCYDGRGGKSGFRAEIEFEGNVYNFNYNSALRIGQTVDVAKVTLKKGRFTIKPLMDSTSNFREVWGLKTSQFVPVTVAMYSPNYWDEQTGNGNRHYFFMLKDCINPGKPNGFYNEFLKASLLQHKRVFEALGSQMAVQSAEDQLSGVGFSETIHDYFVVKVYGATKRILKVVI